MKRKAQIILPKDSGQIGIHCNIKPGSVVVEGGLGSGAFTLFLLTLVGKTGQVISYETRKEFAKVGSDNIKKAGLDINWRLKIQDITKGISEEDIDAVVLDIPEPWKVVNTAYSALLPGGYLASYLPTMNQVEKFVISLNKKPFIEVRSFETIFRDLVIKAGATRPAFDMLGHTGYITVARKVIEE
jgi:tRNA (adenine57-N1/adenine58-N1)-methyltransferase